MASADKALPADAVEAIARIKKIAGAHDFKGLRAACADKLVDDEGEELPRDFALRIVHGKAALDRIAALLDRCELDNDAIECSREGPAPDGTMITAEKIRLTKSGGKWTITTLEVAAPPPPVPRGARPFLEQLRRAAKARDAAAVAALSVDTKQMRAVFAWMHDHPGDFDTLIEVLADCGAWRGVVVCPPNAERDNIGPLVKLKRVGGKWRMVEFASED